MKRILWIFNHRELIKYEVPLIRSLGYEVYIPKKPPFEMEISVDMESDKYISIPKNELDELNSINFYEDIITCEQAEIINKHFDIAMFSCYPQTIEFMVDSFKGVLVLRSHGIDKLEYSFTDLIASKLGLCYINKIQNLGNRFVFGISFKEQLKKECEFFKNHSILMPLVFTDDIKEDNWTGEKKKLLFMCPGIKFSVTSNCVYKSFKSDFKGIPHSIGGCQPIEITNDENILKYGDNQDYESLYRSYSCLYYESTDNDRISFIVPEAIKQGIPLVYMSGGLLDKLGGESLPGRSKNLSEAKKKINKLISGDKKYADKIRKSQVVLLEKFSTDYCLPIWKEAFNKIKEYSNSTNSSISIKKSKRLCVMLPEGYTGGVLDYTIRIVEAIKRGAEQNGDSLELVFAYKDSPVYDDKDYFKPIRNMGISIRKFQWKMYTYDQIVEAYRLMGINYKPNQDIYWIPFDGGNNFLDCDSILLTDDRVPGAVMFFQSYGLIAHDYIQRVNPNIFLNNELFDAACIKITRQAKAVFASTPITIEHAIQYVGISEKKIHLIPVPASYDNIKQYQINIIPDEDYFLWSTNLARHKNHINALEAISIYYMMGGHLKCVVTGVNTHYLDPEYEFEDDSPYKTPYVLKLREMICKNNLLKENLIFLGNLPKPMYKCMLKNAKFFFHPGSSDNGNGTAFDALFLGVPTISSDYRAMRYYDTYFPLNMKFFDNTDVDDMAQKLYYADKFNDELRAKLPSEKELEKKMISCPDIYNTIYNQIKTHLMY